MYLLQKNVFCGKDIKFRSWQTGLEKVKVALNAHPKALFSPYICL